MQEDTYNYSHNPVEVVFNPSDTAIADPVAYQEAQGGHQCKKADIHKDISLLNLILHQNAS